MIKHFQLIPQILKDYISKKITQPIPKPHRIYLTHFTIGVNLGVGEVHPRNAYQIITERSQIIVENKINDGKFIRGICQKYTSSKINKQRQSIYLLIDKAIKKGKQLVLSPMAIKPTRKMIIFEPYCH